MPPFKTLRIIGKRHRVIWDAPLEGAFGECDQNGCVIALADGMPADQLRETLLHEVMHAVAAQMNCDVAEDKHRQLSIGLYAAMRDNPKLVRFLFDEADSDE